MELTFPLAFLVYCFTYGVVTMTVTATSSVVPAVETSNSTGRRTPTPTGIRFSNGRIFYHKGSGAEHTKDVPGVDELYFTQTLDHFNPHDSRTWQQRYFISDVFYKPGGPVILIIFGPFTAGPQKVIGNWFHNTLAEKWGALLLLLEHRYAGESHPTEDASTENLKYLSSRQAVEDVITFTAEMKKVHNLQHNKWLAWGSGLGGSIAAALRMKYPECVDAALALSAAMKSDVNFKEYFEVMIQSIFAKHSQDCIDEIRDAVLQIRGLVNGDHHEWKKLIQIFGFCEPLEKTTLNIQNMYSNLAQVAFASVVQYNENHIKPDVTGLNNVNIADVCRIMTAHTGRFSPIQRYSYTFKFVNEKYEVPPGCFDTSYSSFIKYLKEDSWSSDSVSSGYRQYMYSSCTEFGWFQTSTWGNGTIFGDFPLDFFFKQCVDIFGHKFNKNFVMHSVEAANNHWGGVAETKRGTRTIFTNGKIDPWHVEGVLHSHQTSRSNTVLFIPDTAQGADEYKRSPKDSIPLQYAKNKIEFKLEVYLGLGGGHAGHAGHHTLRNATEPN